MRPRVRIRGSRGRWTAEADGETLPVLHSTFWNVRTGRYHSPGEGFDPAGGKFTELQHLLRHGDRVIMQKDSDPVTLARAAYIGVFRYADLDIAADGAVSLKITHRIADARK